MQILASSSAVLPVRGFPEGVQVRGEMQPRVVWNEGADMNEVHELVYEISWIEELGLWRTFLRPHHMVNTEHISREMRGFFSSIAKPVKDELSANLSANSVGIALPGPSSPSGRRTIDRFGFQYSQRLAPKSPIDGASRDCGDVRSKSP